MISGIRCRFGVVLTLALTFAAGLGASAQTVAEIDDAGDLPLTAQVESARGITLLTGSIDSLADIDMYRITIDEPSAFSASTAGPTGEDFADDTRLFLFDSDGRAVYGNDDVSETVFRSALPAGHALSPTIPGDYFLAVTSYPWRPTDGSLNLFQEPDSDPVDYVDVLGPNPATSAPIAAWAGSGGDLGEYEIAITGVNGTLPITLSAFDVVLDGTDAIVTWTSSLESGADYYQIDFRTESRSSTESAYRPGGSVAALGRPSSYRLVVRNVGSGIVTFRLRHVDRRGAVYNGPEIELEVPLAADWFVSEPFPNPSADATRISVAVRESQRVRVSLFDVAGRMVSAIADEVLASGAERMYHVAQAGLPAGVYIVSVEGERFRTSRMISTVQ